MIPQSKSENIIHTLASVEEVCKTSGVLENCTIQNVDFSNSKLNWHVTRIQNTTFLGCTLSLEDEQILRKKGAYIYPKQKGLPYDPYRHTLYTWQELMKGYQPKEDNSVDLKIYQHFSKTRFNPNINESLNQRIHDHSIDEALRKLLRFNENGLTSLKCVGIMGGHSTLRTDPFYVKTAQTAQLLARAGYFVISGGGPGIMEAANLGAYFAEYDTNDLKKAIKTLQKAPHYTDENYMVTALEVLEKYPKGAENLAVPTWFYGHEPSNLFASHIAKYFSNSIREDTLIAISLYGIVFAPGSAGTTQEIFQDATQNHYGTHNYYSPMVFLGTKRYEVDTLIYPLLRQLSYGKEYNNLMYITDKPKSVVKFLLKHPPVPKKN